MSARDAGVGAHARAARLSPFLIGCVASTWFIWGSTYLAIRFALRGFAPFQMMSLRFLLAGGGLLAWQLARGARAPTPREWGNAALIGTLMLGFGMGGTAYAEQTIGSSLIVAFIAVTPFALIVINLSFGVRPTLAEVLAVALGVAGVLMLTQGMGFRASPQGLIAISIAVLCWSIGSVLSQRGFAPTPGAVGYASEMLCGGIAQTLASWVAREPWTIGADPVPWLAWGYLVVFGTLIAFSAYRLLLESVSLPIASSYTLVNPLVGILLGVTLGGERVSGWEWAAVAVVLSGVMLLFIGRARRARE